MSDNVNRDDKFANYRQSHSSVGYGEHYQKTYQSGYYAELWNRIERPLVQQILEQRRGDGARTCMDFACGTGRLTGLAETIFEKTVGVDVSEQMLVVARERCARAEFMVRDLTTNPLPERFDVITAFRFFLNAESSLRRNVLAALSGNLAPNGVLLVNVHVNSSSPLGLAYRMRNAVMGRKTANTLGLAEMSGLLREFGFEVSRVHWYGFYPRTGWFLGGLAGALMGPVERLFSALGFLPRSLAQSFIIEAKLASAKK